MQLSVDFFRFLRGELSLDGVFTDGLRDTWMVARHKKANNNGLTFPALTNHPTKRVYLLLCACNNFMVNPIKLCDLQIDYIFHQSNTYDVIVINATVLDGKDHW